MHFVATHIPSKSLSPASRIRSLLHRRTQALPAVEQLHDQQLFLPFGNRSPTLAEFSRPVSQGMPLFLRRSKGQPLCVGEETALDEMTTVQSTSTDILADSQCVSRAKGMPFGVCKEVKVGCEVIMCQAG